MAIIEVTESQKKILVEAAKICNLSVGDFLTKMLETFYGSFKFLKGIEDIKKKKETVEGIEETKKKNETAALEKPKYRIKIGEKVYETKSARQMLIKVVSDLGPIRILNVYRGYGLKTSLDKDNNKAFYTKIQDGKNVLYLYTHMSAKDIWERIEKFSSLLKLKYIKEI